jgi:hypothetical protein
MTIRVVLPVIGGNTIGNMPQAAAYKSPVLWIREHE